MVEKSSQDSRFFEAPERTRHANHRGFRVMSFSNEVHASPIQQDGVGTMLAGSLQGSGRKSAFWSYFPRDTDGWPNSTYKLRRLASLCAEDFWFR